MKNRPLFTREGSVYTENFCEENVYWHCKRFLEMNLDKDENSGYAVFITNQDRVVVLNHQLHGDDFNGTVIWYFSLLFCSTY